MTDKRRPAIDSRCPPPRGWAAFLGACGLIVVIWIVVLPRLAEIPRVPAEMQQLDDRQIGPSAMFYTELEAMDRILARLERFHRDHPDALWLPE